MLVAIQRECCKAFKTYHELFAIASTLPGPASMKTADQYQCHIGWLFRWAFGVLDMEMSYSRLKFRSKSTAFKLPQPPQSHRNVLLLPGRSTDCRLAPQPRLRIAIRT